MKILAEDKKMIAVIAFVVCLWVVATYATRTTSNDKLLRPLDDETCTTSTIPPGGE